MRIVTFCNCDYVPVLDNWVRHAVRHVDRALLYVYALDRATLAWCERHEVAAELAPCPSALSLWQWRMRKFAALAREQVTFIHSDADALWLGDVLGYIERQLCNVDFAISEGRTWPPEALQRWGFVLCMGFFYARASPRMARFFEVLSHHMRTETDDQRGVNACIERLSRRAWIGDTRRVRLVRDGSDPRAPQWRTYDTCLYTEIKLKMHTSPPEVAAVRVALLPWRRFKRDWPEAVTLVSHPPTKRSAPAKREEFARHRLWLVKGAGCAPKVQ